MAFYNDTFAALNPTFRVGVMPQANPWNAPPQHPLSGGLAGLFMGRPLRGQPPLPPVRPQNFVVPPPPVPAPRAAAPKHTPDRRNEPSPMVLDSPTDEARPPPQPPQAAVFRKDTWDVSAAEKVARMSPDTLDGVAKQIADFLLLPQNKLLTEKIMALLSDAKGVEKNKSQPVYTVQAGSPGGEKEKKTQRETPAESNEVIWFSPDKTFFSTRIKPHEDYIQESPQNAIYYSIRNSKAAYEAIYGEWNPVLFRRMQDKLSASLDTLKKMHDVLTESKVPLLRELRDIHVEEGGLQKRLHSVFINELLGQVLMKPNGSKVIPHFQLYEYGSIEIEDENPEFEVHRHLESPPRGMGKLTLGVATPRSEFRKRKLLEPHDSVTPSKSHRVETAPQDADEVQMEYSSDSRNNPATNTTKVRPGSPSPEKTAGLTVEQQNALASLMGSDSLAKVSESLILPTHTTLESVSTAMPSAGVTTSLTTNSVSVSASRSPDLSASTPAQPPPETTSPVVTPQHVTTTVLTAVPSSLASTAVSTTTTPSPFLSAPVDTTVPGPSPEAIPLAQKPSQVVFSLPQDKSSEGEPATPTTSAAADKEPNVSASISEITQTSTADQPKITPATLLQEISKGPAVQPPAVTLRYPPLHTVTPASIGPPKQFSVSYLPKHALWNRMAEEPLGPGSTIIDLAEKASTAVYAGQRVLSYKVLEKDTPLVATRIEATVGHQSFAGEGANEDGAFVNMLVSVFDKTKVLQLLMFHDLTSVLEATEDADWQHVLTFKWNETRGHLVNFVSSVLSNSPQTGENTFVKGAVAFSRANNNFAAVVEDAKPNSCGGDDDKSGWKVCRMVFYSHSFWAEGPTADVAVYRTMLKSRAKGDKENREPLLGQFKTLFKAWGVHPDLIKEMVNQTVEFFNWKDEIIPFLNTAFDGVRNATLTIIAEEPKPTLKLTVGARSATAVCDQPGEDVIWALLKAAMELYSTSEAMASSVKTLLMNVGSKFVECDEKTQSALARVVMDRTAVFEDSPIAKWLSMEGPKMAEELATENGTVNPLLLPFLALECGNPDLSIAKIGELAKRKIAVGVVVDLADISISLDENNIATNDSAQQLHSYWLKRLRYEVSKMRFVVTYFPVFFTHGLPFAAKWHSVEAHGALYRIAGETGITDQSSYGIFELIFKIMSDFCEKYFAPGSKVKNWVDKLVDDSLVENAAALSGNSELLTMEKLEKFSKRTSFCSFFLRQVNFEPESFLVDLYLTERWAFEGFARFLTTDAPWVTRIGEELEPLINDAFSPGCKTETYLMEQPPVVERLAKYFVNELKYRSSKVSMCKPLDFLFRMPNAEENFINLCFMESATCAAFLLAYHSVEDAADLTKSVRSFVRKFLFMSYSYVMDRSQEELAEEVLQLHAREKKAKRRGLPFLAPRQMTQQKQVLVKIGQKYNGLLQSLKIILSHPKAGLALASVVNDVGKLFHEDLSRLKAATAAEARKQRTQEATTSPVKPSSAAQLVDIATDRGSVHTESAHTTRGSKMHPPEPKPSVSESPATLPVTASRGANRVDIDELRKRPHAPVADCCKDRITSVAASSESARARSGPSESARTGADAREENTTVNDEENPEDGGEFVVVDDGEDYESQPVGGNSFLDSLSKKIDLELGLQD